jgi:hypothetical protein
VATKKQRRRRQKLQRHEYEYVVETEEGEEVVVEPPKAGEKAASSAKRQDQVVDRRGRVMKPPSWGRVLKRGAIFAPILAILIWVTGGQLSTTGKIFNIAILLAIFIPFSYFVDVLIYRSVQRRQRREREGQSSARR